MEIPEHRWRFYIFRPFRLWVGRKVGDMAYGAPFREFWRWLDRFNYRHLR